MNTKEKKYTISYINLRIAALKDEIRELQRERERLLQEGEDSHEPDT